MQSVEEKIHYSRIQASSQKPLLQEKKKKYMGKGEHYENKRAFQKRKKKTQPKPT